MHFPTDVVLLCIRWYAAYPLSYRHIEEMLGERGLSVDHSTINRWAVRLAIDRRSVTQTQASGWKGLAHGRNIYQG
jgi:transposase-like protein